MVAGVFATTPMAAYAGDDGDYSGTETEQKIKQKNSGGDGSTNINCGENDINSPSRFDVQVCGTLDVGVVEETLALQR